MDLDLRLQHDLVAVQTATELHLLVELTAPAAPVVDTRQPLRIALVVDRSGSMGGDRLDVAKRSARYLVDQLHDDDRMALVSFDNTVSLDSPLGPLDRTGLRHAIDGLWPGGATNLSGGWLKGVEELRRVDDGIRRVVLLSDGQVNEGIVEPDRLEGIAANVAADGISTTTIGIGDGFDEHLMTTMADAGRGRGHFAATPDDAPAIFAEEFDDLVSVVAQNLSVEVRPSPDVAVVEVLNEFPSVAVPDGVQVQVGDAFAGQTMRVVLRLSIPALAGLGLATVGEVVVRWVAVGEQVTEHTLTQALVVNAVSADEAGTAVADPTVVEEVTVLLAGRAAAEARELADRGDIDEARRVVEQAVADLDGVAANHPAAARLRETIDRLERTSEMMTDAAWSPSAAKSLHYESRNLRNRKRDA